jgi:hypothetical protein
MTATPVRDDEQDRADLIAYLALSGWIGPLSRIAPIALSGPRRTCRCSADEAIE